MNRFRYATVMKYAAVAVLGLLSLTNLVSCNDDATVGGSLVSDSLEVVIDTSFTVSGNSLDADPILSRTTMQLLGSIDAPGFGKLSSDFVTQFMPANAIDTTGITAAQVDSLKLFMLMKLDGFTGDSIVPMGLGVYRLTENLKTPIYSSFNPDGKYNPAALAKKVYSFSVMGEADSIRGLDYRFIEVNLPKSFAQELFMAYKENPSNYASPTAFAKNVLNGFYVKTTYGNGRLTRIEQTNMRMYYHITEKTVNGEDSILRYVGNYFAVTPEIITNNNIKLAVADNLKDMVSNGKTLIVAPMGYNAQITFPVNDIIRRYKNNITNLGVINRLTLEIPVTEIANDCGITPPPTLLLVLKNKAQEFFAENKMTDGKTSFYATYDATTKSYTFAGMREYLVDMMSKDTLTPDDYTFMVLPVNLVTEASTNYYYGSSTTVTGIAPYVSAPAMVQLNIDKAKVKLVYTKQSLL